MFKKMEYVYAVYKEQSFSRAAEKLYVSQPCLSAAIRKIEEEVGVPLFERRYSSVRPTQIGLEYIEAVEQIMDIQKSFAAKVYDMNHYEYGSLSIGASTYVTSYIIPQIVEQFSQIYPKIYITLTETHSLELDKKIKNEEIDLIIDSFDEENDSLTFTPLFSEKILLAVPAVSKSNEGLEKYRILPKELYRSQLDLHNVEQISIDHFKDEKFILLKSGNNMYKHACEVFRKSNFTPKASYSLNQLITSYAFAASNNGVCFVTDTIFKYHAFHDDMYLYNVENSGSRTLYVAQKRNRYTTQAMGKFIEMAKRVVTE